MQDFKRLFAIDLDGTLLSKRKKILKPDLLALKKYYDAGGQIVIITGKSINNGKKYVSIIEQELNIKLKYAAFLNGSVIYDLQKDKIVESFKINDKKTKIVFDACKKHECNFLAINEKNRNDVFYLNKNWLFNIFMKKFFIKNSTYHIMSTYDNFECYKLNIVPTLLKTKQLKKFINELSENNDFDIATTKKFFCEITLNKINKAYALKTIASLLKINLNDTAAIGDSNNDVPMLKIAKIGFGINNDNDQKFKDASDVLINRKNKNPVAFVINNFLLK